MPSSSAYMRHMRLKRLCLCEVMPPSSACMRSAHELLVVYTAKHAVLVRGDAIKFCLYEVSCHVAV